MSRSILLVDDDPELLHGLCRALRNQPYQIYTARSGDEAQRVLQTHPIAVIVADERMPGMSGNDLLAWAVKHVPDTGRIMLTGTATPQTAMRAINESGVWRFFTKPCDVVELALAIRQALEFGQMQRGEPVGFA